MRIFLAVFPPPETQALAASVIDSLRRPGDGVAWVKPGQLHFTLRFLGELDDDGVRRAEEATLEAAAFRTVFDAALGGAGAFPSARDARVLWLGLSDGAAPLRALAERLESALDRHGFERDRRGFEPHLTIGRVREGPRAGVREMAAGASPAAVAAAVRDWASDLAAVRTPSEAPAARFSVRAVCVVESTLAPGGSSYRVRQAAALSTTAL